jgi:hypothetical protein
LFKDKENDGWWGSFSYGFQIQSFVVFGICGFVFFRVMGRFVSDFKLKSKCWVSVAGFELFQASCELEYTSV